MTSPLTGTQRLAADSHDAGERLDVFVARRLPHLSRALVQRLIRAGHVTAGGRPLKPSAIVTENLVISVVVPAPTQATPLPEPLPLPILFDDPDFVVVDKPAGMVVHPAAGHRSGTLVNALLHHVRDLSGVGGTVRPGIVHRLDRGTSGVMVVAKNDRAHRDLSRQFLNRTVTKEYVALVLGTPRPGHTIDRPIGRDPRQRVKMSSRGPGARPAVTTVLSVEPLGGVSLVRLQIGTGRTHQIRVHLSEAGHAVVGDALYGGVRKRLPPKLASLGRLERSFLHAARLTFLHPGDHRPVSFEAPLPPDLAAVLAALRRVRDAEHPPSPAGVS